MLKAPKHAAAPWKRETAQSHGSVFKADIFSAGNNRLVAEVFGRTKAEANANATIVESALVALAALETCERAINRSLEPGGNFAMAEFHDALIEARNVLAKAGRG